MASEQKLKHGLPSWGNAPHNATAMVAFPDDVEGYKRWFWAILTVPYKDGDCWLCAGGWQDTFCTTFDGAYDGAEIYLRPKPELDLVGGVKSRSGDSVEIEVSAQPKDVGQHYRYGMTLKLSQRDIDNGFVHINLDPYRICDIYSVGGGPREHIVKKSLRGVSKGHTERELIRELRGCIDRWEQMLDEDEANADAEKLAVVNDPRR